MYKVTSSTSNQSVLNEQGIEKVFAPCPPADGFPFDAKKEAQFDNGLTLDIWIGLWQKAFCENPKQAYKFLMYTGYTGGQMKSVIKPIMMRPKDIVGQGSQHRRFVFNCFVVGHASSGKSTLLDAIIKCKDSNRSANRQDQPNKIDVGQGIDKPSPVKQAAQMNTSHRTYQNQDVNDKVEPSEEIRSVINVFQPQGRESRSTRGVNINDGQLKYVIFTEIPESLLSTVVTDRDFMNKCDAIAFLYDNDRDHINFIKENISKFDQLSNLQLIPKMLIQTKMDLIQQQSE